MKSRRRFNQASTFNVRKSLIHTAQKEVKPARCPKQYLLERGKPTLSMTVVLMTKVYLASTLSNWISQWMSSILMNMFLINLKKKICHVTELTLSKRVRIRFLSWIDKMKSHLMWLNSLLRNHLFKPHMSLFPRPSLSTKQIHPRVFHWCAAPHLPAWAILSSGHRWLTCHMT